MQARAKKNCILTVHFFEIEGVRDFCAKEGKEGTLIVVYEQESKLSMVGRMSSLGRTWNTFGRQQSWDAAEELSLCMQN